jgi:hypothetical protein
MGLVEFMESSISQLQRGSQGSRTAKTAVLAPMVVELCVSDRQRPGARPLLSASTRYRPTQRENGRREGAEGDAK